MFLRFKRTLKQINIEFKKSLKQQKYTNITYESCNGVQLKLSSQNSKAIKNNI